jgi:hypothetical protein
MAGTWIIRSVCNIRVRRYRRTVELLEDGIQMKIIIEIDTDTVMCETDCSEKWAEEFLKDRGVQIKCAIESSIGEYIGEIYPDWEWSVKESQRDDYYDRKLHARREGDAA